MRFLFFLTTLFSAQGIYAQILSDTLLIQALESGNPDKIMKRFATESQVFTFYYEALTSGKKQKELPKDSARKIFKELRFYPELKAGVKQRLQDQFSDTAKYTLNNLSWTITESHSVTEFADRKYSRDTIQSKFMREKVRMLNLNASGEKNCFLVKLLVIEEKNEYRIIDKIIHRRIVCEAGLQKLFFAEFNPKDKWESSFLKIVNDSTQEYFDAYLSYHEMCGLFCHEKKEKYPDTITIELLKNYFPERTLMVKPKLYVYIQKQWGVKFETPFDFRWSNEYSSEKIAEQYNSHRWRMRSRNHSDFVLDRYSLFLCGISVSSSCFKADSLCNFRVVSPLP